MGRWIRKNKIIFVIILFAGFTGCIYAPYEMYLNNADDFWFTLAHFWWIPLVCGGIAMVAGGMVGSVLRGTLRLVYEGIVFGFAIAMYLQGNFLNLDVGLMDGTAIEWTGYYNRFAWNACIWLACICISVCIAVFLKERGERGFFYISLLLTGMQAVALTVLMIPAVLNSNSQGDIGYLSNKDTYAVSEEENILVFILDMFDDEYLDEILENEPELENELDGFTQYRNFTGNYSTTQYSILSIASGKYFFNETGWMDWRKNVGEQRLYMDELADSGYDLGIYLQEEFVPDRLKKQALNYEEASLRINHYKDFTIELYRFVLCKYFPDMIKPLVWMDGTEFERWKEPDSVYGTWSTENFALYDGLMQNGVAAGKEKKQLKMIHINGSHPPYNMDEYCNRTWAGEVTPVQCGRGALRIVQQYMEGLKDLGVYDQTSIIITADHGYYWAGVLTNPSLMIKEKGARGALKYSDAPVSQHDLSATILDLADIDYEKYGDSILKIAPEEKRDRKFYQYFLKKSGPNGNCRLVEYRIDDIANDYENFHLTDVEYTWDGVKRKHSPYCRICQDGGPTKEQLEEYDPPRVVHELIEGDY